MEWGAETGDWRTVGYREHRCLVKSSLRGNGSPRKLLNLDELSFRKFTGVYGGFKLVEVKVQDRTPKV